MHERDERNPEQDYRDPDDSPWPAIALGVLLSLVCLILIARIALAVIAGQR
jgi:hypothetical protein